MCFFATVVTPDGYEDMKMFVYSFDYFWTYCGRLDGIRNIFWGDYSKGMYDDGISLD